MSVAHSVSIEGHKKPYSKPTRRVYGSMRTLTAAVAMMGSSDGGTSMAAGKT